MYLAANAALIVDWAKLRRRGVHKNPWLWVAVPVIGVAVLAIPVWGDLRPGQASPFDTLPWLTHRADRGRDHLRAGAGAVPSAGAGAGAGAPRGRGRRGPGPGPADRIRL